MQIVEEIVHPVRVSDTLAFHYVTAGTGQPLVFVHGGMGDYQSWAPQWADFVPHFRCYSYSRRHSWPNRNAAVADHSVLNEADDLLALLAAWEIAPAILVGTSYGAYTALAAALKAPERVSQLVLTEPPMLPIADDLPGGSAIRQAFQREVLEAAAGRFAAGDPQAAVHLLAGGINGAASRAVTDPLELARRVRNAEPMRVLAASREAYPMLDRAALARLAMPILLTVGEQTGAIHRTVWQALAAAMPQAVRAEVPASGHGNHRDNPAAYNALVLGFLGVPGKGW